MLVIDTYDLYRLFQQSKVPIKLSHNQKYVCICNFYQCHNLKFDHIIQILNLVHILVPPTPEHLTAPSHVDQGWVGVQQF